MAIRFQCDCGLQLKAEERLGGKIICCPDCGEKVPVPRVGEDPASYSISGASRGDEGWATLQAENEASPPNWTSESTFQPALAKETPELPVTVQPRKSTSRPRNAIASWGESFVVPFRGGNAFTLVGWTIVLTFVSVMLSLPGIGFLTVLFRPTLFLSVAAFFFHFLCQILRSAANGDETLPDTEMDGVVGDALNWWACILVGTAPWWGFHLVSWYEELQTPAVIGHGLLVLAGLYTPMALLATTLFNTVLAANPIYVLGAILRIPWQYLGTCLLMGASSIACAVLKDLVPDIWGVSNILTSILFLYTSIVVTHLLGTVYYRNRKRIGWFRTE